MLWGASTDSLVIQLDDLNKPFTFGADRFDLVNSRLVCNGINAGRWNSYIRDIRRWHFKVIDLAYG